MNNFFSRKLLCGQFIGLVLMLSCELSHAQEFVEPFKVIDQEILDRYQNLYRETVTGDQYNPADGSVLFKVTDISIPGNFDLPVELTRWIPVEDLRTGGPTGWNWNVPMIRAYYMKNVGGDGSGTATPIQGGVADGKNCTGFYSSTITVGNRNRTTMYLLEPYHYWDGKLLHIPNKTSEKFLLAPDTPAPQNQITKSNFKITSCTGGEGTEEGVIVKGPSGETYTFSHVKTYDSGLSKPSWVPVQKYTKLILATEVRDRFGNTVRYNYDANSNLSSIVGSDGRRIDIHYETYVDAIGATAFRAAYAEANGKRWKYEYSAVDNPIYKLKFLHGVKLPDNSTWKYDDNIYKLSFDPNGQQSIFGEQIKINGEDLYASCHTASVSSSGQFTTTVTNPDRLSTTYIFKKTYHGRANVNPQLYPRHYQGGGSLTGSAVKFIRNLSCQVNQSLSAKSLTGPGMKVQSWSYQYSQNVGTYTNGSVLNQVLAGTPSIVTPNYGLPTIVANKNHFRTATVIGPEGKIIYYIDRLFQSPTEGAVLAEEYLTNNDEILKRTQMAYAKDIYVGKHWFVLSTELGAPTEDSLNAQLLQYRVNKSSLKTEMIYTDGVDTFETKYQAYDDLGYEGKIIESNEFSDKKRFTKKGYIHDRTNWILGLPTTTHVGPSDNGYFKVNELVYHSTENTSLYSNLYLPYEYKSYGYWIRRYPEFHSDGLPKKIEYNQPLRKSNGGLDTKNRYQLLTEYKRGKSQRIETAQRYSESATMVFSRTVNDDGLTTSATDLNGVTAYYEYDSVGRLKSVDLPAEWSDQLIEWEVPTNSVTKRTSRRCKLTTNRDSCTSNSISFESASEYDPLGRIQLTHTKDVLNKLERYQLSEFNSMHLQTFASFKSELPTETEGTTHRYDGLGRVTSVSTSNGGNIKTEYLARNRIRVTDPVGNQTTTTYLAYGSPEYTEALTTVSPENVTTTRVINFVGDVLSITQSGPGPDGIGTVTQTEYRAYDVRHNLCKITRSDVGTTVISTNILGQPQWHIQGALGGNASNCVTTSPNSEKVTKQYDNQGALWKITYPDGGAYPAPDITYNRDNIGNILTLSSGSVTQTYNFNELGLIEDEALQISNKAFFVDYTYNANGDLASITYPDGDLVEFNPNAYGEARQAVRISRGERPAFNYATDATYYPNGMLNEFNFGNGISHKTTLNNRKLPERIRDSRDDFTAVDYSYLYDDNMRVASLTDNHIGSFTLKRISYDGLGRLKTTEGNFGIGSATVAYDGLGNITSYKNKKHELEYAYDSNNRLDFVIGTVPYDSFSYDARGNVLSNSHHSFSYNLANQLAASGNNKYTYDGHNRRVAIQNGEGATYSFYGADGQLLYIETPKGSVNYIYLGKKLIAKDGVIPDSAARARYLPFGGSVEGEKNDVGYTGHKFDTDIQLSYMQARYYDPVIGRFYSNDPIGFIQNDLSTFNRYSYVGNDPVNKNDPTGEFANFVIGAGIGIAAELLVQTVVEGKSFSQIDGGKVMQSAAVGAISGGVGGATAKLAGSIGRSIAAPASAMHQGASRVTTGIATGAIGGAAGAAAGDASKQLAETGNVDSAKIVQAATTGAITGGLSGAAGGIYQASAAQKTLGDARAQTLFTSAKPGAAGGAIASGISDAATSTTDAVISACQQKSNGC